MKDSSVIRAGMFLLAFLALQTRVGANMDIDLDLIAQIESGNNPASVGDGGLALGAYQIHAPVVQEFNQFNKLNIRHVDVADPAIGRSVAEWYLTKRIPQMLIHFNQPITVENILTAYNAGIASVVKGVRPKTTQNYIMKYQSLLQSKGAKK